MAGQEIHKRHVAATVQFAINHIPQADAATLEKFLELVYVEGNFGSISVRELLQKMELLKKYIPATCETSLIILAELLGICWPMTTKNLNISIFTMEEINN
jgi:hypothetical protein